MKRHSSMHFTLWQIYVGHTDRWSSRYNTLPLRACRRRCAAVFCHTLLHHLLHLFIIQQGERYLVHPQVGALRRPRHFLECHVGVWVLLQNTCRRSARVNRIHSCIYSEYTAKHMWIVLQWRCMCYMVKHVCSCSYLLEVLHFCTAAQRGPWCASAAWQGWPLLP